jgi:HEAT repeat protein
MEHNSQFYVEAFSSATKQKKLDLLRKISSARDENILPFLVTCLADEFWIVRKTAADVIKEFGEAAVSALSGALNSYNQDVQHWSLQILGEIGNKGLPAILRAMKSNNDEIRYFACTALGNSRIPQGVTVLLRALGDERWRVRKAASDALVKYGEAVIAPLQQVLKITEDEDIRFWTIKLLANSAPRHRGFCSKPCATATSGHGMLLPQLLVNLETKELSGF